MTAPRALVIEDSLAHAVGAQLRLEDGGFVVETASSFIEGTQQAYALLAPTQPVVPTLILLDLKLPHPRCPGLDGTTLAAQLSGAMRMGELQLAHIIAITSDDEITEERREEILFSGCHMLLIKPLQPEQVRSLRTLVDQPPILTPYEPHNKAVAHQAQLRSSRQIIQLLDGEQSEAQSSSSVTWDKQHVKTLLLHPTRLLREEPWASWIRRRGGIDAIYRAIAAARLPPKLSELRTTILECIPTWETGTERLKIARQTYYRHLDRLAVELTTVLNDLQALENLQDKQRM